ncbi:ATP-dependent zinc metalloprotease FtsH [Garciella nitratireducens]|uniref:ATP-dependent zinc metalloprotease FtsH n=1 Tax=Garciella nitratireducens DSM 15102 TaxID=1121911 RepID=A0A1T4KS18_9FIRM|nr:ATP-dependent zinc metalloprotease FtsH [Garciella nitratireducens]SJZ45234.1 cell division protease FtsH [Garciella nitratireducens DSM 15102]
MKKNLLIVLFMIFSVILVSTFFDLGKVYQYSSIKLKVFLIFLDIALIFFIRKAQKKPELMLVSSLRQEEKKEDSSKTKVYFDDVAGLEEVKEDLQEIIDFMKNPEKYNKMGAKIPRGIMFYGPPGTGKTLLASAISGETNSNFIYASGSEFVEKYVGVGASRIRSLFEKAKKQAPCVIFIDEMDAIGVSRSSDNNSERDQTLNQLLIELDGFNRYDNIVVIGATNRIELLDEALLRPGRFDRHIYIGNPNVRSREEILKVHLKNKPLDQDVNIKQLARKTHGMSGAHLANIVNEAAIFAVRENHSSIGNEEFNKAIERVMAGLKNKSAVITEKEKKIIAYHEAGHALVGRILNNDLIEKISIVPHGQALGFVLNASNEDRFLMTKKELCEKIQQLLAGRASEEIIFNEISTGAQNDLAKATEMANEMVCEYGMSTLGNRTFNHKKYSSGYENLINKEINLIIESAYKNAKKILQDNLEFLHAIANKLLTKETISGQELEKILKAS